MKVFAHRAGNNLALIQPLKAAGFRTVEGDVMLARGEPIMVHPEGLPKRLPNGQLDYTSGEVVQLMATRGVAMPTLRGILEVMEENRMQLLLESKLPGTLEQMDNLFGRVRRSVIFTSFFGSELVLANCLGLVTAALMAHAPTKSVGCAMVEEYRAQIFLLDQWCVDAATVRMFHNDLRVRGQVVCYTVNDLERAHILKDMGVDAILSDIPRELVDLAQGGWLEPG